MKTTCERCGSDRVPGTEPAIVFQCGATGTWQPEACHTIAGLRAALKDLADAAARIQWGMPCWSLEMAKLDDARKRALRVLEGQP